MLQQRTELILRLIVEDYIKTAETVGSKYLVEKFNLSVSAATVRNEMSILERGGYIRQPHTSAGRIPTEKGYLYYLKNITEKDKSPTRNASIKSHIKQSDDFRLTLKTLAKKMVEMSGETAVVAFNPYWSYYAGVSNLFHKPDFYNLELVRELSDVVGRFDDMTEQLFELATDTPTVYIGSSNPFGEQMATIVVQCKYKNNQKGLLGIVGPLRMDYVKNLALVDSAKDIINKMYD